MIEDLLNATNLKKNGMNRYRGSCPNHSKGNQNLMLFENDNGGLNLYCHAGCSQEEIMSELGLPLNCLYPPRNQYDNDEYKKRAVLKAVAKEQDQTAIKLWNELVVLRQVIEARIFNEDKHPTGKHECWDREKQALHLLPTLLKEYYEC